jgi:hypothetical protein
MRFLVAAVFTVVSFSSFTEGVWAALKAGAAAIDITPTQLPVLVNGGMTSRTVDKVVAKLHARAIVVDDGTERLAIVVVDSCMIGRTLLDDVKHLAAQRTKIRPDHMLISATHTHSAPSSMACLGTELDADYVPLLRERLVEVIVAAEANLEPAEVGWAVANAADYTALRRWIIRPDRIGVDPFGNPTLRANMHAGADPNNVTGESGPEDPDLSLIAFRSPQGRPIAVLANFSMHYFGAEALHPDYFGLFCDGFPAETQPAPAADSPPFVAIMSHGCSGDIWRRDYKVPTTAPLQTTTIDEYTRGLLKIARTAYQSITYSSGDIEMHEVRLPLKYRVPDRQRLQWAEQIVAKLGDRLPETTEEVYAREQVILNQLQSTEVVIQALRIADIAIATTPNETYALTGLKLKLQSPLAKTMVIELANGGDGYIPPPEQHLLGGYNTWAARSAGLEVLAEPKIAAAALQLLEKVSAAPARTWRQNRGPAAEAIAAVRPAAWFRMDEFAAPHAVDSSGRQHDAVYEPGVVFFLDGPASDQLCGPGETNRCAHFAGGRMRLRLPQLTSQYSLSVWFWNGMPTDARATTGWLFSRERDFGFGPFGDHLGLTGTSGTPGRLMFQHGRDGVPQIGRTEIPRWTWCHLVLVRNGDSVRVYLNGDSAPEIEATVASDLAADLGQIFIGGRSDQDSGWEGRLDEVALFDRPLTAAEIALLSVR